VTHSATVAVFVGTKAQYIKTAPVLREFDRRAIAYWLIDSGQHGGLATALRSELGIRDPDVVLGGSANVATVSSGLLWMLKLLSLAASPRRLRREMFPAPAAVCLVHGDTMSTLIGCLLARRAGLRVAHIESGLRSWRLTSPFPEELVRIFVMRLSAICFAPSEDDAANLERMGLAQRTVLLSGNTSIDAVRYSAGAAQSPGPVVATMHRLENLKNPDRVRLWLDTVVDIANTRPVRVVLHDPTAAQLDKLGLLDRLEHPNIAVSGLVNHAEFLRLLSCAPFAIVDGGSIQEECSYLGVPTLLWRAETEREHGIGANVVLSRFDRRRIADFVSAPYRHRTAPSVPDVTPSAELVDALNLRFGLEGAG
jgi:UDP-N-acetylglucosamine 2-epimerase (non-hydrolysing)